MRALEAFIAVLLLGCVVAVILAASGVTGAASAAITLGGFGVSFAAPLVVGEMGNWGVPGDQTSVWPGRNRLRQ